MKKEMRAKLSRRAAEVIYDNLCIKSDCFVNNMQKPVAATSVIAIDDDPTSALWAVWLYYKIHKTYGYYPGIVCVGGIGPLSRLTGKDSEADRLYRVCRDLGVNKDHLFVLSQGTNTGANIKAVRRLLKAGTPVIWSVTKRQSLRTERTVALQAPELKSYYYVIEETLDEASKPMNGKGLCNKEIMYHELAGILQRCEKYAGKFQKPVEERVKITSEIRWADDFLRRYYRLKTLDKTVHFCGHKFIIPNKNLRSLCQYLYLVREIKKNRWSMEENLSLEVWKMAQLLCYQNLVSEEERKAFSVPENISVSPLSV